MREQDKIDKKIYHEKIKEKHRVSHIVLFLFIVTQVMLALRIYSLSAYLNNISETLLLLKQCIVFKGEE